ncbi:MAG: hypothetical protein JST96_16465, partial [Bacteroidetes bacterium]|nr:hypothetical protein [Bacteroidota bacterium]
MIVDRCPTLCTVLLIIGHNTLSVDDWSSAIEHGDKDLSITQIFEQYNRCSMIALYTKLLNILDIIPIADHRSSTIRHRTKIIDSEDTPAA